MLRMSRTPRAADRSTVRSHTKDTHKSTEWKTGPTAHPLLAPQALTRRRWHGWLQEVRHLLLPLLGRLLLSCCVSCCAGPPQASGCCSSTNAPGRPESSAGASDKASFVLQLVQLVRCCSQRCLIRAHYHITQLGESTLAKLTQTTRGPSDLQMSLE